MTADGVFSYEWDPNEILVTNLELFKKATSELSEVSTLDKKIM